jgi:transposase-like protein
MDATHPTLELDEHAIDLITQRVIVALRDELELVLARLAGPSQVGVQQLTVEQVAERLGVARSTVYAHWREWGGYKLGDGDKAPIRFDGDALPFAERGHAEVSGHRSMSGRHPTKRRPRRRDLLTDAPRLSHTVGDLA